MCDNFDYLGIAEQNYFYYYRHGIFLPKVSLAISQNKQKLSNSYLINPFTKQEKHFGKTIQGPCNKKSLAISRSLLSL